MPSILENGPAEILIEQDEGSAPSKRNAGAARATQPYLYFCDDDAIMRPFCLEKLYTALSGDPDASFAYSDTTMVLYDGIPYPNPAGDRKSQPWDFEALKRGNFIETMSLIRTSAFLGFDPEIRRFQDWDLWLSLGAKGHRGVYVPEVLFELHHFDKGISASYPFEESLAIIKKKHGLKW
jgi:glycosyltransferase involved in cell wall biosynthesis